MTDLRFVTSPPPPDLPASVRELWLLDDDGGFHAGLPKPYVEIVISLSGIHWWRAAPAAEEFRYAEAWVTPVQDRARYARAAGRRRLIGARLEPWAAIALFGPLPPGDGTPPPFLSDFIGREAGRLRRRLIEAQSDAERCDRFGAWLSGLMPLRDAPGLSVSESAGTLTGANALARSIEVSPRTLRRRFAGQAGIAPKRWLRLKRIDSVLRDPALLDPGVSLAAVAAEHGYADQAHMTRDVLRLTGVTPAQLRRRTRAGPPHLLPGA